MRNENKILLNRNQQISDDLSKVLAKNKLLEFKITKMEERNSDYDSESQSQSIIQENYQLKKDKNCSQQSS